MAIGKPSIATLCVHGGEQHDPGHHAIIPPITTATSFVTPDLESHAQFCYSRCGNPTRHAYETALRDLEGGVYCTATASGMAATALALELLDCGSHVVVMEGVYGGTHRLFEKVRRRTMGLEFSFLDLNDIDRVLAALKPQTRMIWVETPTNPLLALVDVRKLVEEVREREKASALAEPVERIFFVVDNTFSTAWNQRPLELGADVVMLSSSKYIGGHSDMTGGALITSCPDIAAQLDALKTAVGAIASPFEAYLALRGMKTLDVRMERQCRNALAIAEFLEKDAERVSEVHYPGLRSSPFHELCQRQMRSGGAVVTIRLNEDVARRDEQEIRRRMNSFFKALNIFVLAESLGGVESMVNHSATMSHGSMGREARASVGVFDTTLRLSVGVEDVEELKRDLDVALEAYARDSIDRAEAV